MFDVFTPMNPAFLSFRPPGRAASYRRVTGCIPLQPGNVAIGRAAGDEGEQRARLEPVLARVTVNLDDPVDRLFVADEREGCDQRAGADSGDGIEGWTGHRPLHAPPALEHAGAERAPVAAAGHDQNVDGRRPRRPPGRVSIVLGLDAHDVAHDQRAAVGGNPLLVGVACADLVLPASARAAAARRTSSRQGRAPHPGSTPRSGGRAAGAAVFTPASDATKDAAGRVPCAIFAWKLADKLGEDSTACPVPS